MDLRKAILLLRSELKKVEAAIAALEKLDKTGLAPPVQPPLRRGRKSMGPEERLQVAERMRRYWAARRAQQSG
jgi:hypothetical protein